MKRNTNLYPPINFMTVEDDLYRSGSPYLLNYEFLSTLRLKTIVVLDYLDENAVEYFNSSGVNIVYVESSLNSSVRGLLPIAEEMATEALKIIVDKTNFPCLITCRTGKSLSGVMVACLRKIQRWSFISIFEEYRRFAGSKSQQPYENFIELFDTDLIKITPEKSPEFLLKTI
eukprot:gene4490-6346_t